jgi:formylglycine-generating enzyme required for sulfatase activity
MDAVGEPLNYYSLNKMKKNTPSIVYWIIVGITSFMVGCTVKGSENRYSEIRPFQIPFESYTDTIPGSNISFEMIAVPGGEFIMGSPAREEGHQEDEEPVHPVEISPFWMGKHEITWDEYEIFVYPEMAKEILENAFSKGPIAIDGISQPTPPFVDMSFGMGKKGFPAINMTQYAALNYCKWLSAITGEFYRLPTEAEWEYACRAGTTTAYSFGEEVDQLEEYAWYYGNSENGYKKVGTKKANPWGLHDMHGNVAEWTLDGYFPKYMVEEGETREDPWVISTQLYPHVVRGGSWDDDPEDLRSAARLASNPSWKQRDPQIPKSNWWMTDASFLGFRIVRPHIQPSPEEIEQYFADPIPDL